MAPQESQQCCGLQGASLLPGCLALKGSDVGSANLFCQINVLCSDGTIVNPIDCNEFLEIRNARGADGLAGCTGDLGLLNLTGGEEFLILLHRFEHVEG